MRYFFSFVLIATATLNADAGPFGRFGGKRSQGCSGAGCSASYAPQSYGAQQSSEVQAVGESGDALDEVNTQRAQKGLRPYKRDEGLTEAAQKAAAYRAARRIEGHTSNDFAFLPSGCQAITAGCAAVTPGWGFLSCGRMDNHTYAGAAWVMGSEGKKYCHAFYR
jgi:hypothetical protein